jgi:hypothetical protein
MPSVSKKTGEKKRPKINRPDRYSGPDRRKGPRQIHIIDNDSTDRDLALARSDLEGFFLDVLEKHHGGW